MLRASAAAGQRSARPRSGGTKGLLIAFGSLGCLSVPVLGVLALAFFLYGAGRKGADGSAGAAPHEGPIYNQAVKVLLPKELGGYELEKIEPLDAATLTMLGAINGVRGRYSGGMSLLALNYSSAERAGLAVGLLRSALFPDQEGWVVEQQGVAQVGHRVAARQESTRTMAALWSFGSLVLIFGGDATQMPRFEKSAPALLSTNAG
ncbi:MAG: hypothetical protein M3Y69_10085 [Verrucomicrobiota bacterium]|nr:hypothetical protein [Verrucomicrobiota bacterium]